MQIPPTCMWLAELSLVRKETSSALSLSMCPWAMAPKLPADASPRCPRVLAASLALTAAVAGCGGDSTGSTGASTGSTASAFDAERAFSDLRAQVEIGPRPAGTPAASANRRELIVAALARRRRVAGANQRPYANVVGHDPLSIAGHGRGRRPLRHEIRDPGSSAPTTAPGVAVLLELARALPPLPGPSVAAGLVRRRGGARRPVVRERTGRAAATSTSPTPDAATRARRRSIGSGRWSSSTWSATATCGSRSSANSDPASTDFADAATSLDGSRRPSSGTRLPGRRRPPALLEAGIPALDLIDFDYGPGPAPGAYWHTPKDTIDNTSARRASRRSARRRWSRSPRSAEGVSTGCHGRRLPSRRWPRPPRSRGAPKRVLLAAPRGYCAGVDRAVQTVEQALEIYGPPVYVRKEIVHNKHVVRGARQARRDLRRGGDRGARGRDGRVLRPRRGSERARQRRRPAACARSTRPVRWSPRSTSRRASSPSRATRSS